MRKITEAAVCCFALGKPFHKDDTAVTVDSYNEVSMFLHGNLIAKMVLDPFEPHYTRLSISNAGWKTSTTKERLNGILNHFNLPGIKQIKGTWYIGKKEVPYNEFFKPVTYLKD